MFSSLDAIGQASAAVRNPRGCNVFHLGTRPANGSCFLATFAWQPDGRLPTPIEVRLGSVTGVPGFLYEDQLTNRATDFGGKRL